MWCDNVLQSFCDHEEEGKRITEMLIQGLNAFEPIPLLTYLDFLSQNKKKIRVLAVQVKVY